MIAEQILRICFNIHSSVIHERRPMYDIFLSYASQDRDRVRPLYDYLSSQGWNVFWDHLSIGAGTFWEEELEKELKVIPCVIVIWSKHSVNSKFVRAEARIAQDRKVLIPIALDDVKPPLSFGELHTINFKSLDYKPDSLEFKHLLDSVNRLTLSKQQPSVTKIIKRKNKALGLVLALIISAAVFLGIAGYFYNSNKDIDTPNLKINQNDLKLRDLREIKKSGFINIATRQNIPPMGFEKNGKLMGVDIEIAEELARSLGVKPIWRFIENINERESLLINQEVDVVISSYSITEEREKKVDFSIRYFSSASVVMIRDSDQDEIKKYTDLNYKKVAVLQGSINESDIKQFAPNAILAPIKDSMHEGYDRLYEGSVDAVAYDKPMIEYYIANHPEKNFNIISEGTFNPNNYAIGVNLSNKMLLMEIDSTLKRLLNEGFIDRVATKYSTSSIKIGSFQCSNFTEEYLVKKNDTLSKIAFKAYSDPSLWEKIYACNDDFILDPSFLRVNQKIKMDTLLK